MISTKSCKPGYSYIELMVAVLVIVTLMGFVVPKMFKLLTDTNKASTKNTLKVVEGAIDHYKMTVGTYPQDLKDLVVKPEGATGWDGPYVGKGANPELPQDAWKQPLVYQLQPRGSEPAYKLYSQGDPDKDEPINA